MNIFIWCLRYLPTPNTHYPTPNTHERLATAPDHQMGAYRHLGMFCYDDRVCPLLWNDRTNHDVDVGKYWFDHRRGIGIVAVSVLLSADRDGPALLRFGTGQF